MISSILFFLLLNLNSGCIFPEKRIYYPPEKIYIQEVKETQFDTTKRITEKRNIVAKRIFKSYTEDKLKKIYDRYHYYLTSGEKEFVKDLIKTKDGISYPFALSTMIYGTKKEFQILYKLCSNFEEDPIFMDMIEDLYKMAEIDWLLSSETSSCIDKQRKYISYKIKIEQDHIPPEVVRSVKKCIKLNCKNNKSLAILLLKHYTQY